MHREAYCDGAGITAEWAEGTAGDRAWSRAGSAWGVSLLCSEPRCTDPTPPPFGVRPPQTLGSLPTGRPAPTESEVESIFPTVTLGPKGRGHISNSSQTHIWDSAVARPGTASPSREDRPPAAPEPLRWSWRQEPWMSGHQAWPGWGQGPEGQGAQAQQSLQVPFSCQGCPSPRHSALWQSKSRPGQDQEKEGESHLPRQLSSAS